MGGCFMDNRATSPSSCFLIAQMFKSCILKLLCQMQGLAQVVVMERGHYPLASSIVWVSQASTYERQAAVSVIFHTLKASANIR